MPLKIILAFLIRDFKIEKAYRLHFLVKLATVGFQFAVFFFLGKMVNENYFPFVFTGLLFSKIFEFTLSGITDSIRQEQHWGTLESLLLCPKGHQRILFSMFASKTVLFFFEFLAYILIGVFFFGISLSLLKIFYLVLFWLVVIFSFYGLGLLNASYVLVFKRGDPAGWLISTLTDLLSGVYFPSNLLPLWLVKISYLLPTTYALAFIRQLLFDGTLNPGYLLIVFFSGFILYIAGTACLKLALNSCKKNGTLGSY
ncbi:MAG: hypothetical protein A2252_10765 [Elusimicrobia bacterium RIFOXYA2_FULL_39_19]|nr:MAG: hypothetical protein A2252_10765 [Elusimicrobia bacterium RIFOXYA2_FULL_39_19]